MVGAIIVPSEAMRNEHLLPGLAGTAVRALRAGHLTPEQGFRALRCIHDHAIGPVLAFLAE